MTRRLAAAAMLPILLLAGAVQASVLYRCEMDGGQLRAACCCRGDHAEQTTVPTTPSVSRAACCASEAQPRVAAAPATANLASQEQALLAASPPAFPITVAQPLALRALVPSTHAPPPSGPPLLLLKSSRLL